PGPFRPDLRTGTPAAARARVAPPPRELRAVVFREFIAALEPLRRAGKLGGILFQFPPYIVPKPSSYDYLEWARDELGGDDMLVEFRHRDWFAEERRAGVLSWLEGHGMTDGAGGAPRRAGRDVASSGQAEAPPAG